MVDRLINLSQIGQGATEIVVGLGRALPGTVDHLKLGKGIVESFAPGQSQVKILTGQGVVRIYLQGLLVLGDCLVKLAAVG